MQGRPIGRVAHVIGVALIAASSVASVVRGADTVVVYTALDREFSEPLLNDYAKRSGVRVLPKFDIESTKTVGLTNLIAAEASQRPALVMSSGTMRS